MPEINDINERKAIAAGFQKKLLLHAARFQQALNRPATTPPGLQMILVTGDSYATANLVAVDSQTGRLRVIQQGPGDGSVLRGSALMNERMGQDWSPRVQTPIDFHSILFLPERHLEMTSMDVFRDNVLLWLLEDDR